MTLWSFEISLPLSFKKQHEGDWLFAESCILWGRRKRRGSSNPIKQEDRVVHLLARLPPSFDVFQPHLKLVKMLQNGDGDRTPVA